MPYKDALQRLDEIQTAIDRSDITDVASAIALGMALSRTGFNNRPA